jgi:predicted amidohydrolase YtcJ
MYAQRLGGRWQRTNPYRDLLDQGVYLAGGSDSPITPMNPVAGIAAAVRHPNHRQRLSGDEALALFTTGAARALQLDSTHGTVEPGRAADLVLLTADPRTSPQAQVVATVCAGRCIYSDHELASGIRLD